MIISMQQLLRMTKMRLLFISLQKQRAAFISVISSKFLWTTILLKKE